MAKPPSLSSLVQRYLARHGQFVEHNVKTFGRRERRYTFVPCQCDICQDALKVVEAPVYAES